MEVKHEKKAGSPLGMHGIDFVLKIPSIDSLPIFGHTIQSDSEHQQQNIIFQFAFVPLFIFVCKMQSNM